MNNTENIPKLWSTQLIFNMMTVDRERTWRHKNGQS